MFQLTKTSAQDERQCAACEAPIPANYNHYAVVLEPITNLAPKPVTALVCGSCAPNIFTAHQIGAAG